MHGQKIRQLRKEVGLTQEEFARSLMLTRQQLGRWENGESRPSDIYLEKISLIYYVSIEWLKSGKGEKRLKPDPVEDRNKIKDILEDNRKFMSERPGLYSMLSELTDNNFMIKEDEIEYLAGKELEQSDKVEYLRELGRYRERKLINVLRVSQEEHLIIEHLRGISEADRREVKEFIEFKASKKK